eukprot:g3484.t1
MWGPPKSSAFEWLIRELSAVAAAAQLYGAPLLPRIIDGSQAAAAAGRDVANRIGIADEGEGAPELVRLKRMAARFLPPCQRAAQTEQRIADQVERASTRP